MVCRCATPEIHADRADRSQQEYLSYEREEKAKLKKQMESMKASMTPDPTNYEILEAEEIGRHLVVKALFPSCVKCSYEGQKVLVYYNTTALEALKWRELDPHFRPSKEPKIANKAPSPTARFPASPEGWIMAKEFAGRSR